MIIEESISGTLCRLHLDENSPKYQMQWILTESGEIKALMATEMNISIVKEFGAWCVQQKQSLRLSTAVRSIAWAVKRFGFREFRRE